MIACSADMTCRDNMLRPTSPPSYLNLDSLQLRNVLISELSLGDLLAGKSRQDFQGLLDTRKRTY